MYEDDTPLLRFELMQADDYGRYFLATRNEVMFYLRAMMQKRAMLSLFMGRGANSFLTSLLQIDERQSSLLFDAPRDMGLAERASTMRPLVFVTSLDKVKIQFQVDDLALTEFEGGTALRTPMPARMLRLQRREYYRLVLPSSHPLKCTLATDEGLANTANVELQVLDISAGGLAIVTPPDGLPFVPEMVYPDCRVHLPDIGLIEAALQVRNVFSVTLRNGQTVKRAGCQFVDLSPQMSALIQRYIMKIDRARNARSGGLV
ncbi:MAG: flagellar brake protein [Rhodocyclaceae bacterium]|nr:flagellar brake protein [Rhodocyclaceae bacterium]MBX3668633.1 flagellar brake protein [Rhodocyclaceae bacterium]